MSMFSTITRRLPVMKQRRWLSSIPSATNRVPSPSFGIAFDIDGVLIRGGDPIPRAKQVLQSLESNNVPYIFLTNGGGCHESHKAESLGKTLDMYINPKQVQLSHTPMQQLANTYGDSKVLIMGSHDVYSVAESYGFKKVVSVEDIAHHYPYAYPFRQYPQKDAHYADEEVEAIIVMHDPTDWAPEIQIATDVLIGGTPPGSGRSDKKQTPLYTSNNDFLFSGAYPHPRYAQGAFTSCLRLLYEGRTGKKLEVTRYGKPESVTYTFAEGLLNSIANRDDQSPLSSIYGIGDNPHSDIHGANQAGGHWSSILVRTGIYDGSTDPEHTPDEVVDSVFEAIEHIYEREGIPASTLY